MLDKAAVIICETNEERERLKSVFPEMDPRVTIIPPGTSRRPPSARQRQDRVRVLSVGRLDGYKRVDQAIRAMRFLPNNYVLCVVGDGPSRSDLEDECAKFGLTDRVQFLGRLSDEDLGAQWELADIFVTLSRLEAWGLGVLDALATGIPCVVSAIPAHQAVSLLDPGHAVEVSLDANDEAVADAIQMAHSIGFFSPTGLPTWSWVAEQLQSAYLNAVGGVLLPGDAGPSQHL
jgi:glycosyltransferase involved in cell wall biosynthesis